MSQPGDIRQTAATALEQVAGLRAHAKPPGAVVPPAALVQHTRIVGPVTLGSSVDYRLRIVVLVQLGDFRNVQDRVETLIDPSGTVSTSAVAALLSDATFGQVVIEDFGDIEYGGAVYAGAILNVDAYA